MQRFQQSGKVKEFRAFSDARGGFMLVDIDSAGELRELIGITMLDHFHIETHPVTSLNRMRPLAESPTYSHYKRFAAGALKAPAIFLCSLALEFPRMKYLQAVSRRSLLPLRSSRER